MTESIDLERIWRYDIEERGEKRCKQNQVFLEDKEGRLREKGWPRYKDDVRVLYGFARFYLKNEIMLERSLIRASSSSCAVKTRGSLPSWFIWCIEYEV